MSKITLKKSAVTGKVPAVGDLDFGEVAINYADGILYYKNSVGNIGVLNPSSTSVSSFNTRTGAITLTSGDVTTALGFTPYNATNPSGYISGNQTITFSGDASGSGATAVTLTLANSGATAGTYRSVTVDAKGRVTAGTNPTTLAGYGITDAQPLDGDLTAIAGLAGTTGFLKKTAANTWALDTNTYLTGNQSIIVSGDASGTGTTAISLTLANSGVTAGTYNNSATAVTPLTLDVKGRVTATGTAVTITPAWSSITSKPTTISGFGITDAYTKTEVDGFLQGLDPKASVRAATTANITLSGTQTIDGVAVVAGDRVLVKDQTTASQNGIYVVAAGAWTRSTDLNIWAEFPGAYVFVEEGTANQDFGFVCTSNSGGTLETTSITWVQFNGAANITAGTGLDKSGNTLSLATGVVTAGTYRSVTVDTTGRVTAGTNPTTLAGYGITDAQPLDSDLTAIASLTPTADNFIVGNGTSWILETPAQARASLGGTTAGQNLFTLTNPSAVTFLRVNADNTVSALDAATFRTAIGAGTSSTTGTVTSVSGTGSYGGLTLTGTVTSSGSLTLGGTPTGTWPISVSGNSATVTNGVYTTNNLLLSRGSVADTALDTTTTTGIYLVNYTGSSRNMLVWNTGGSTGIVQFEVNYGNTGEIRLRNQTDSTTWSSWRTFLTNQNYNSYSPTLTGTGASGTWGISITGSAATLTTSRTIGMTGDVTWTSASFNGSANVTGTATLANSGVTAGTYTKVTVDAKGRVTTGTTLASADLPTYTGTLTSSQVTTALGFTPMNVYNGASAASYDTLTTNGVWRNQGGLNGPIGTTHTTLLTALQGDANYGWQLSSTGSTLYVRDKSTTWTSWRTLIDSTNYNSYAPTLTGTGASGTWGISITGSSASTTGNAATATTLQTARNINGTSFNGSANITTASWGTARTLTIGSTGKSVDGSANVSWSLAEIGALPLTGGTLSGLLTAPNFADATGSYNVNLGSGGSEGRGLVAGYSGGSYGGIGYNVRHTTTGGSWIAPSGDTSSYLLFTAGGFAFYGAGAGTAGRTLSFTTLASLSAAGTFNAVNLTNNGNQVLHAGNYTSYSPSLTGSGASGTWGINITGNAATVTNGLTTSNYSGYALPLTGGTLSGDITFSNGRKGLVGVYDAAQTQAVFAMGPSYVLTNGGASNVYGNFYGLAWSYNPDYGGAGNNPQSKPGLNHQLLLMMAGTTRTALGSGVWTEGTVTALGNVTASGAITQAGNQVLHAGNYTSYSPSLTGSGASGTWGISVTGNAATATTLQTARTINGVSFNGSANISVNLNNSLTFNNSGSGAASGSTFNGSGAATISYNTIGAPSTTGTNASGTWSISITGYSYGTSVLDTDRSLGNRLPTSTGQSVRFDFANATATGTGGNYAGVMTFSPWSGTTASTGDASYQLAFGSTATNGGGNPQLRIRKGIDSTWNSWVDLLTSANYTSYSPSLTGSGASGTWGISITGSSASTTGNAATATTLQTARTINGVSFNGSANITVADSTKLALTGGTLTGLLTGRAATGVAAITGITAGGSGFAVNETNVGSSAAYVPAYGHTTVYTGGYRSHMVLGSYRTASAWGGGPFIAWGGNDNNATEVWQFNTGGSITHSGGRTFLDSTNYSSYALPLTGGTLSGHLLTNAGVTVSNSDGTAGYGINLYAGNGYRPTYGIFFAQTGTFGTHGAVTADWATYFTMNSTNNRGWVFRMQDVGTNVASINTSGTAVFNGNVTAYSDERLKKNWVDLPTNFVEQLAQIKNGVYDRTDDNLRQVGVSAQSLQQVLPEAIIEGEYLSVAYGNAALAASVELAKRVVQQDQKIAELTALVQKLLNKE